jgi:hypothetical protein
MVSLSKAEKEVLLAASHNPRGVVVSSQTEGERSKSKKTAAIQSLMQKEFLVQISNYIEWRDHSMHKIPCETVVARITTEGKRFLETAS